MIDNISWEVFSTDGTKLIPRKYGNKTQTDTAIECAEALNKGIEATGKAFVFFKGPPGSGKSLIGLTVARSVGKTLIVVPKKNLQNQYNLDYSMNQDEEGGSIKPRMTILKDGGVPLTISTDKGRGNFKCKYMGDRGIEAKCSNTSLPCIVNLLPGQARKSVAINCPYWCPISSEPDYISSDNVLSYESVQGEKYIFVREAGCKYYEQFINNIESDVTIINNKKFLLEATMGRLPSADLLIIDEVDLFLDELKSEYTIHLSSLRGALAKSDSPKMGVISLLDEIEEFTISNDVSAPVRLNSENESVQPVSDLIKEIVKNRNIYSEDPLLEDLCNHLGFYDSFSDIVWVNFNVYQDNFGENSIKVTLFVLEVKHLVNWLLSMFPKIIGMSATIHDPTVLDEIYGIPPELYSKNIIKSSDEVPGTLNLIMTGKEIKCNMVNMRTNRKRYLEGLSECLKKCDGQTLIHITSYADLPSTYRHENAFGELRYGEEIRNEIKSDPGGSRIIEFKNKRFKYLWSTIDIRGTDLPGNMCNNIIFTKAPYPNPSEPYYKALSKVNNQLFWKYYNDKMKRELIQGTARGLRSPEDTVNLFSPDIRVFEALQSIFGGSK